MGNPWDYDFSAVGARKSPLLLIHGSDQDAVAVGEGFRATGNSDIYRLLPERSGFDQVNLSKQFLKRPLPRPELYDCVVNLVTDPDQHPKTLDKVRKLLKGHKGRIVNRPDAVLRTSRDQVAKRLAGIDGLRVPKVIRLHNPKPGAASAAAAKAGLAFPIIARMAGTHTGHIVALAETPEQLDAACLGAGDFILIEFADFRSADGLYRKYRLWSFGGRTLLRHAVASDHWNVHVKARYRFMLDRPNLIAQEEDLLARPDGAFPPSIHAMFDAVKERMGLEFFGMDFGIGTDGRAVLFEANPTMSFFPLVAHPRFAYLEKILQPAREAVAAMTGLAAP
jgi:hypothetical protein